MDRDQPTDAAALPLPPLPVPGEEWALFVDIDGTLVGFSTDPAQVRLAPATLAVLERLSTYLRGALAVLSGRGLTDVDRLLSPLILPCGAMHGLERRDARGYVLPHLPPAEVAARVGRACAELARQLDGVSVEDKAGVSFALHYRVALQQEAAVRALAADIAAGSGGHYGVQPGDCVAELKPRGQDKGTALAALMETAPFTRRRPVVLGDDLTDETAFREAVRRDGFGVLVGLRRPTAACFALPSPAATVAWLERLAAHLESLR